MEVILFGFLHIVFFRYTRLKCLWRNPTGLFQEDIENSIFFMKEYVYICPLQNSFVCAFATEFVKRKWTFAYYFYKWTFAY